MSCEAEQWKIIRQFPDYLISSVGRVFSLKRFNFMKLTINTNGYLKVNLQNKNRKKLSCQVHQLVASTFIKNPEQKRCVDHINNNGTDNRVQNLRFAAYSENNKNRSLRSDSTTKVKGVYFNRKSKRFQAYISIDGIRIHLGCYTTLEEAKQARTRKANEAFGEFIHECEKM